MINKRVSDKKTVFSKFVFFALFLGIVIGFIMGFIVINTLKNTGEKDTPVYSEIRAGGYQFTNPLLDCDNFHPSILKNHVRLQNLLNDYVDDAVKTGTAEHISVYFRSLNNGPWIGINENDDFYPASLQKVPLLIAVLKKAETDSTLLKRKILLDQSIQTGTVYIPNIVDTVCTKFGNSYTIDELLQYMIIHSDNNASITLRNLIGQDYYMNVMTDLGVNLKNRDFSVDYISVKEYSSFYRIMYNASYLNRDMSEKALKLLSRTNFNKGIPNKLPGDIKISHKFGERGLVNSNLKQLHDCGIVYVPDVPYLLCVMTKGRDFNNLTKVISDISEIVYKCVSNK
jgi:beta-lactamase class A